MSPIGKIAHHASRTEFRRYFCAGSLAFVTDFAILFLLTEFFGVNYLWSNLVAVSVGLLLSYLLCVKWVFLERRYSRVVFEFPIFTLTSIVGLLLNELLLWVCVEFAGIGYLVAKVIVTAAVFVFNFALKKNVLFRVDSN